MPKILKIYFAIFPEILKIQKKTDLVTQKFRIQFCREGINPIK